MIYGWVGEHTVRVEGDAQAEARARARRTPGLPAPAVTATLAAPHVHLGWVIALVVGIFAFGAVPQIAHALR